MAIEVSCPQPINTADTAAGCISIPEWNARGSIINSLSDLIAPIVTGAASESECTPLYLDAAGDITTASGSGCIFLGVHIGNGRVVTASPLVCVRVSGSVDVCDTLVAGAAGVLQAGTGETVAVAMEAGADECVLSLLVPQAAVRQHNLTSVTMTSDTDFTSYGTGAQQIVFDTVATDGYGAASLPTGVTTPCDGTYHLYLSAELVLPPNFDAWIGMMFGVNGSGNIFAGDLRHVVTTGIDPLVTFNAPVELSAGDTIESYVYAFDPTGLNETFEIGFADLRIEGEPCT